MKIIKDRIDHDVYTKAATGVVNRAHHIIPRVELTVYGAVNVKVDENIFEKIDWVFYNKVNTN